MRRAPGDRTSRRTGRWAPTLLAILAAAPLLAAPAPVSTGRTIGLVLTSWRHALYETPDKQECPNGLQVSERKQLEAMKDPKGQLKNFGSYWNRGPNGEDAAWVPEAVEDPLPIPQLQTKVGYGLNLDGTDDGRATAKTCKHDKFHDPEGQAVDNQMARVIGCTQGWRKGGFMTDFWGREFETSSLNRILVEVSGVDDEQNDPDVQVAIYKGKDGLVPAGGGKFVPFTNQRIDDRIPRFTHKVHGRIQGGVLVTDPIPVANFPLFWVNQPGERRMRDVRLRLKLTPDGAEGMLAGYEDLKVWWSMHGRSISLAAPNVGVFSNAAYYRDSHRYADGYPDPKTGQCTAISAAYKVTAVKALISHPKNDPTPAGASLRVASAAHGDVR